MSRAGPARGRKWLVAVIAASGCLLVATLLVRRYAWTSPPAFTRYGAITLPVPIMTTAQYGDVFAVHARPYVWQLTSGDGAVLFYGASHTRDPKDPQIADLHERWTMFRPTVALVEGRMGFLPPLVADPVRQFGESGAVYRLARAHHAAIYTWEPPIELEVTAVLETASRERVALFYILRPYFGNLRHGRLADPEAFVEEYRRKRVRWPGLENSLPDMASIDAIWKRDFPGLDWRDESDEDGLPGYLADIAARANGVRDEHLARVIVQLVGEGQRVFVVAGSSHAVKLEPAIRGVLAGDPQ